MRILILMLLACSCSIMMGPGAPPSAKGKGYKISFTEPGWKLLNKDERSDYVFENPDGRILLSNSFCGEFQEQALDHLAHKTFKSVGSFQSSTGSYAEMENREAYRLDGKGKVDGVPVGLQLLNTRRNNCYFDFVSIVPEKLIDSDVELFDRFLKSVEFQ
jgi:hypothetical protein